VKTKVYAFLVIFAVYFSSLEWQYPASVEKCQNSYAVRLVL